MKDSFGREIHSEEPIFPLLSFNPDTNTWKCVGTGFFIQGLGGFVTAKHVFFDNNGNHLPTLYGVQTTTNEERHIRSLKHFVSHPTADIAVGFLGQRRLPGGVEAQAEVAPTFQIDMRPLSVGDSVQTFAFPNTQREVLGDGEFEFSFTGIWSQGVVVDCHEEGFSMLRNRCYQTTMRIESGASGGPVLRNHLVVGINSTSFDTDPNEEPVSFITPIDLILELQVPIRQSFKTIQQLIDEGHLYAKR